jgi:rare lipoprotein A
MKVAHTLSVMNWKNYLIFFLIVVLSGCAGKSALVKKERPRSYTVFGKTYYPMKKVVTGHFQDGIASWYGPGFNGKKTSSGEIYDMHGLTAAHNVLPLNTLVKVTNLQSGKDVVVRINDRGPFVGDRVIDLSLAAARGLGMVGPGTAPVRIAVIGIADTKFAAAKPGPPAEKPFRTPNPFYGWGKAKLLALIKN